MEGALGTAKILKQRVDSGGPAGTTLNLQAWSKATGVTGAGGDYAVKARVEFTDGTADTFVARVAKSTHNWRRQTASYVTPKDFQRVVVSAVLENQSGTAWFDALHLWKN